MEQSQSTASPSAPESTPHLSSGKSPTSLQQDERESMRIISDASRVAARNADRHVSDAPTPLIRATLADAVSRAQAAATANAAKTEEADQRVKQAQLVDGLISKCGVPARF